MKKLLWIIGTGAACVIYAFLVGVIAMTGQIITTIGTHSEIQSVNQDFLNPIMAFGWVALIILSIWMWKRWNAKCHACKRWNALKLLKTEILKQEKISVLVELKQRNMNREVTGTQDQYIPGKRKTYQDTYQCKYCGNLEIRTHTEDSASV